MVADAFGKRPIHFSEMGSGEINPTELIATLMNQEATFEEGIRRAQDAIGLPKEKVCTYFWDGEG